jgi:hypothetical protein
VRRDPLGMREGVALEVVLVKGMYLTEEMAVGATRDVDEMMRWRSETEPG